MNGTKFTPGSWSAYVGEDASTLAVVGPSGLIKAPVIHWLGFDDVSAVYSERKANAHLIAAAPDLYEALKLALEYWNHRQKRYKNRSPVWVQDARTAMAKARGES